MKRVVIVGCPGAGKSTFAKKLAVKTQLPLVHLDYYHHQKPFNYFTDKKAWNGKVKELMQPKTWIIDGNYSSTYPERFMLADTIVFFDIPRHICFYRIAKRRIYFRNKKREEMPDDWVEKLDPEFLKYVWKFNKSHKPKILERISKFENGSVIIFKKSADADQFLNQSDY